LLVRIQKIAVVARTFALNPVETPPDKNPMATAGGGIATETVRNADGTTFLQLQYTQRVLLVFNGLVWPHISVATLT
jgi:hypothetical protein